MNNRPQSDTDKSQCIVEALKQFASIIEIKCGLSVTEAGLLTYDENAGFKPLRTGKSPVEPLYLSFRLSNLRDPLLSPNEKIFTNDAIAHKVAGLERSWRKLAKKQKQQLSVDHLTVTCDARNERVYVCVQPIIDTPESAAQFFDYVEKTADRRSFVTACVTVGLIGIDGLRRGITNEEIAQKFLGGLEFTGSAVMLRRLVLSSLVNRAIYNDAEDTTSEDITSKDTENGSLKDIMEIDPELYSQVALALGQWKRFVEKIEKQVKGTSITNERG